jgi:hypothetical protein
LSISVSDHWGAVREAAAITARTERARVASLSRSRTVDDPDLVRARQNLKAARLEEHIAEVVAAAPPLTSEQRDRLAALLRPDASDV